MTAISSERGDDRPLVDCAFSPDGQLLATAAWSGLLKLWGLPACDKRLTIKAHEDRITGRHQVMFGLRQNALPCTCTAVDQHRRGLGGHKSTLIFLRSPLGVSREVLFTWD